MEKLDEDLELIKKLYTLHQKERLTAWKTFFVIGTTSVFCILMLIASVSFMIGQFPNIIEFIGSTFKYNLILSFMVFTSLFAVVVMHYQCYLHYKTLKESNFSIIKAKEKAKKDMKDILKALNDEKLFELYAKSKELDLNFLFDEEIEDRIHNKVGVPKGLSREEFLLHLLKNQNQNLEKIEISNE